MYTVMYFKMTVTMQVTEYGVFIGGLKTPDQFSTAILQGNKT